MNWLQNRLSEPSTRAGLWMIVIAAAHAAVQAFVPIGFQSVAIMFVDTLLAAKGVHSVVKKDPASPDSTSRAQAPITTGRP